MKKGVIVVLFNKTIIRSAGVLGLLVAAGSIHAGPPAPKKALREPQAIERGRRLLAERNARFVENKGQWAPEARFMATSPGLDLWYTDHGIRFEQVKGVRRAVVDMAFVGGHTVQPVGQQRLRTRMDVIRGRSAITNIGSYREVLSKDVLPGVSMRGYYEGSHSRYDLILAPGAKPASIQLRYPGASGLSVQNGALKIGTRLGGIQNSRPVAYQTVGGRRVPVAARWVVTKAGNASFKVGAYDTHRALVIDPLIFGTYYGADRGPDEIRAAVQDPSDNGTILVGASGAPRFPSTTINLNDTNSLNPEQVDAFLARISSDGTNIEYSVLIGGEGDDVAQYAKVDPTTGDIFIAGTTITGSGQFDTFPTTNGGVPGLVGNDNSNATNFFVARFTHAPNSQQAVLSFAGSTVFGLGPDDGSSQGATFLTGFDLRAIGSATSGRVLGNGATELAFTGITTTALPESIIPSGSVDQGHFFYPAGGADLRDSTRAGFLIRFTGTPENEYEVNNGGSQYIESRNRETEAKGVVLDAYGRAYVAGTIYRSQNQSNLLNVDTNADPSTFLTVNAYFNPAIPIVDGRQLRATDTFVRIYGPLDRTPDGFYADNTTTYLELSTLFGGNGDEQVGGMASSLAGTPIYTGSPLAVGADGSVYVTGTTSLQPLYHSPGAYGIGFTPPATSDQDIVSDVFMAKVAVTRRLATGVTNPLDIRNAVTRSTLAASANLNAHARNFPRNGVLATRFLPSVATTAMPSGLAIDRSGYVYVTGNLRPYAFGYTSGLPDPAKITASTISTTPAGSGLAADDATYAVTAANGTFPTTEGFLVVLDSNLSSSFYYGSYIGGALDDMVFAPSFFDSYALSADKLSLTVTEATYVPGWTDGARAYGFQPLPSAGILDISGLGSLISTNGVKSVQDVDLPDTSTNSNSEAYGNLLSSLFGVRPFIFGDWNTVPTNQADPFSTTQILPEFLEGSDGFYNVARDGFVSALTVGAPTSSIGLSVTTTAASNTIGAFGGTRVTVTLNGAPQTGVQVQITRQLRRPASSSSRIQRRERPSIPLRRLLGPLR